jgi:hypothetical protein
MFLDLLHFIHTYLFFPNQKCKSTEEYLYPYPLYMGSPFFRLAFPMIEYILLFTMSTLTEDIALAGDALSRAIREAPEGLAISVRIFVTTLQNYISWPLDGRRSISSISSETAVSVEKYEAKTGMYILGSFKTMRVLQGRPNLEKELQDEVENTRGRMSVSGMSTFLMEESNATTY